MFVGIHSWMRWAPNGLGLVMESGCSVRLPGGSSVFLDLMRHSELPSQVCSWIRGLFQAARLFALMLASVWPAGAQTPSAIVSWDRIDSHTNLAAYVVLYGTNSGQYHERIDVATNRTSTTVEGLSEGQVYYFVVIARSVLGLDSYPSREVAFAVGNVPPVARDDRIGALSNRARIIRLDELLLNDVDPNGDPLIFMSFSEMTTNGAALVRSGTNVLYAPLSGFTGTDSFSYTVSDGNGGTSTANVLVTVWDAKDPAVSRINQILSMDSEVVLEVFGVPGLVYTIERSVDLKSWQVIASITAPPSGTIYFTDPSPSLRQAFYRAASP
jgi:hypothetical protein